MLDNIKKDIKSLSLGDLQELRRYINDVAPPSVSYQKRGDYYYAFFRYGDRVHTVYVGKEKREIDPLTAHQKNIQKNLIKGGPGKMGSVFLRKDSWVIEYSERNGRIKRESLGKRGMVTKTQHIRHGDKTLMEERQAVS